MENWAEALTILIPTALMFGASFKFMWNRLDKRFDAIDKKFDSILLELKEIKMDIRLLDSRISKLEVRVEERTLRVVHVQKTLADEEKIKEN